MANNNMLDPQIQVVTMSKHQADTEAGHYREVYSRVRVIERTVSALGQSEALFVVVVDRASNKERFLS